MSLFPQTKGEISLNDHFQWILDGVEIRTFSNLEIRIGGHWIPGGIVESERGLYWFSWLDNILVQITFGIKARLPKKAS